MCGKRAPTSASLPSPLTARTSCVLRRLVEERHRGEIEERDLARALHAGLDHVALGERRAERLGRAIELALLDLGALELHEDALVLDGARHVPSWRSASCLPRRGVNGRSSTRSTSSTPRGCAVLHDRHAAHGAHRARARVVRELVARLETVEHDVGSRARAPRR